MKIPYIVPFVPWQIRVRSFNLITRLARKHEIQLVRVSSARPSAEQKEWLSRYCTKAVHVPHSPLKGVVQRAVALPTRTPMRIAYCKSKAAEEVVRRVYEEVWPDVVYVERWRALQHLPVEAQTPVVCDPTDSMSCTASGSCKVAHGGKSWWAGKSTGSFCGTRGSWRGERTYACSAQSWIWSA